MFQNCTECSSKLSSRFLLPSRVQTLTQETLAYHEVFKHHLPWKKSCTTLDVQNPGNDVINYQPQLLSRITSINSSTRTIVELDWFVFLTITGLVEKNPTWYPKKVVFCKTKVMLNFLLVSHKQKNISEKNTQKRRHHIFLNFGTSDSLKIGPPSSRTKKHTVFSPALSHAGSEPMIAFKPLSSCRKEYSWHVGELAKQVVTKWGVPKIVVPPNQSKSSILIGFSIFSHPFWGTPIFGNTQKNMWDIWPKLHIKLFKTNIHWVFIAKYLVGSVK